MENKKFHKHEATWAAHQRYFGQILTITRTSGGTIPRKGFLISYLCVYENYMKTRHTFIFQYGIRVYPTAGMHAEEVRRLMCGYGIVPLLPSENMRNCCWADWMTPRAVVSSFSWIYVFFQDELKLAKTFDIQLNAFNTVKFIAKIALPFRMRFLYVVISVMSAYWNIKHWRISGRYSKKKLIEFISELIYENKWVSRRSNSNISIGSDSISMLFLLFAFEWAEAGFMFQMSYYSGIKRPTLYYVNILNMNL